MTISAEKQDESRQGKPLTVGELLKAAKEEARVQGALRGPILIKEWGGAEIYYRRLNSKDQARLNEAYEKYGRTEWVHFASCALDSDGNHMFGKSIGLYQDDLQEISLDVLSHVVDEMISGSRTKLSEEDLGNSSDKTTD